MLVIVATRTAFGEDAFDAWGWRIPFLASAILLGDLGVDAAQARREPGIRQAARGRRDVAKAPLREAFAERDSLKRVLIAFFGIMCAQGAVWYFTFFYMQVFLEKSLGVPGATKDMLLIVMTLVSAPLYVFFGWLQRPHRAQAGDARRDAARAGALFPRLALDRRRPPTRRWSRRSARPRWWSTPIPRPARRSSTRPGTAKFTSACDIAKSMLVARGVSYTDASLGRRRDHRRGRQRSRCRSPSGEGLERRPQGAQGRHRDQHQCRAGGGRLSQVGRPQRRSTIRCCCWSCWLFVVAATALYGPQAAALVEMFPTRVRYTAMSLPYHVGTGWVGGFLPVTSFAIVAMTGNIYAGLWYAVVLHRDFGVVDPVPEGNAREGFGRDLNLASSRA